MRLFLPIILVAAAIGLFVLYTNNAYQGPGGIKDMQAQIASFDGALDNAAQLKSSRDQLLSKRNTFSPDDLQKLERILPDNIDNIRFTIDIQNIAARRNLTLKNVSLGSVSDSKGARGALAVGSSGDPVGSADISFSVTASYDDFLAFLQDIEHSLRLVNVQKITFKPLDTKSPLYDVSFNIRTYWLH